MYINPLTINEYSLEVKQMKSLQYITHKYSSIIVKKI